MRIDPSHIWMNRETALASWQRIITVLVLLALIVAVTGFHTLPVLAGGSTCTGALDVPLGSAESGVGGSVDKSTHPDDWYKVYMPSGFLDIRIKNNFYSSTDLTFTLWEHCCEPACWLDPGWEVPKDSDGWIYDIPVTAGYYYFGFHHNGDESGSCSFNWYVHHEEPNEPPTAYIDSISPNPATQGTDTVSFSGHGTDPDGSVTGWNWRSSIDGQLSTSDSFSKPASELSVGPHTIYFKVKDNDGVWSTEDAESLTIQSGPNEPPTAYIDSISPNPATQGTDTVSFTGHGTDSDGSVVAYRWVSSMDGQLSTSSSFSKPASELSVGTHTIYFEVQDDDGAWSTLDSETLTISVIIPEWRKEIQVGDILLHRDSWLIHCLIGQEMTHAGIYVGDGWVVESLVADANDDCSNGVAKHRIECWDYPNDSCVELRRVGSATIAQRIAAAEWAIEQTERDPLPGFTDLATVLQGIVSCEGKQSAPVSETWYCTELVWASYYNQGVDLDHSDWGSCLSIITPDELRESTYLVAQHTEEECLDCLGWLKIEARCPVELRVTDPEGLTISKESNEISGAMYVVFDSDEDGDPSKIIGIPEPKPGDYHIEVIPDTDASPTDTYGLIASVGDSSMVLAEDTSVADIPDVPYVLTVTIPGELPGLPCFIATATYGTAMADEVQILRDFRDDYLLSNPLGQSLVDIYYRISPPIAEFITDHPTLKAIVKVALVPAITMSTIVVATTAVEKMAILGLLVLVSVAVAIWAARRRKKGSEYA